jgi:hypothetical protein
LRTCQRIDREGDANERERREKYKIVGRGEKASSYVELLGGK